MTQTPAPRRAGRAVDDRYRQTRRKLYKARQAGPAAVAAYLAASFMARRLVGLERGRPGGILEVPITGEEILAFQQHLVHVDQMRANTFGSVEAARAAWREQVQAEVGFYEAQALADQIHDVGESALLFFGFADNTSRAVTLQRAGSSAAADTEPAAEIAPLVRRLFEDLHGLLVVIASKGGEIINAYDLDHNRFVETAQRSIRVVAVVNRRAIYFEPERARECLECGDAFTGHLPRLAGATYEPWGRQEDHTEQE